MGNTLIQVSDELWKELNDMKTAEDKTFEDVIQKILKEVKEDDK